MQNDNFLCLDHNLHFLAHPGRGGRSHRPSIGLHSTPFQGHSWPLPVPDRIVPARWDDCNHLVDAGTGADVLPDKLRPTLLIVLRLRCRLRRVKVGLCRWNNRGQLSWLRSRSVNDVLYASLDVYQLSLSSTFKPPVYSSVNYVFQVECYRWPPAFSRPLSRASNDSRYISSLTGWHGALQAFSHRPDLTDTSSPEYYQDRRSSECMSLFDNHLVECSNPLLRPLPRPRSIVEIDNASCYVINSIQLSVTVTSR